MAATYVAGVSYYTDMIQTAVLKMKRNGPVLCHLSEEKTDVHEGAWFLHHIIHPTSRLLRRIGALSIGIDNRSVFYHSFPVESASSLQVRDEQINWELSHYIGDYEPDEFIRDVHTLVTDGDGSVSNLLVVAANRHFIRGIQSAVRELDITLQVIETNYLALCYALSVNYPETDMKNILLASMENDRIDAGILRKGKQGSYRGVSLEREEEVIGFLGRMVRENPVDEIFIAGPAATHALVNLAGDEIGVRTTMLNPVRKIGCKRGYLKKNEFAGVEHRFASVIGCALRKR